ncbi:MAG: PAAR domain-containing protein [Pirellulaceae bacterium]
MFLHQEQSFPASGEIGNDGSYTLLFNGKPAVPVGTYDISVIPPPAQTGPVANPSDPEAYKSMMMGGEPKKKSVARTETIPHKYRDAAQSGLTCTVMEGQETVFDVDLKSAG